MRSAPDLRTLSSLFLALDAAMRSEQDMLNALRVYGLPMDMKPVAAVEAMLARLVELAPHTEDTIWLADLRSQTRRRARKMESRMNPHWLARRMLLIAEGL